MTPAPAAPDAAALLLVDLQHDFLDPTGAFPRRHVPADALLDRALAHVVAARARGDAVVWVTSVYGELPGERADLRGQTHVGKPCCRRGSQGARLVPAAARAMQAGDEHVEKRWYSGFRDTDLHARLRARGVSAVRLAGVATSVCVLATARDALRLGYDVAVHADATAAGSLARHEDALRELTSLGGRVLDVMYTETPDTKPDRP